MATGLRAAVLAHCPGIAEGGLQVFESAQARAVYECSVSSVGPETIGSGPLGDEPTRRSYRAEEFSIPE